MTLGALIVLLSLILIILGMPIVWVLGSLSGFYVVLKGFPLSVLAHKVANSAAHYPMLAVPLFMFAGKLMNSAGITNRIFRFADDLVGYIPGGLGHVNVIASLIFAGMSGSPVADVAGLGEVEIKAMKERGYDLDFSTGITLSSAILGPIFPPSVPMVLLGVMAEISITGLFLGGFLPAFLIAMFMMTYIYLYAKRKGFPVKKRPPFGRFIKSLIVAFPPMLTPVIIVGGMTLGIFSPTEAATVAVLYALFLGAVVYRELTYEKLAVLAKDVVMQTARLMIVIASALLFGWVLVIEQVPQQTAKFLVTVSTDLWIILLVINVVLLFLGAIIENMILLLILAPMLVPAMTELGMDPLHFGIIMVFNIMFGQLTPPMGLSLYVGQGITGLPFDRVCRSVVPFFIPLLTALLVVTYVPSVVLIVPRFFGF